MAPQNSGKFWHSCPACTDKYGTPKRTYLTKSAAKKVRKIMGEQWMHPYPCPSGFGGFHLGHLPGPVRRGELTRGEMYGNG